MRWAVGCAFLLVLAGCAQTAPLGALDGLPVADAGPDQEVRVGDAVTLLGQGRDPEGAQLAFRWTLIERPEDSGARFDDPAVASATFVADRAGVYVAQLVVEDGEAASVPDLVTVRTVDLPPEVDAGPDLEISVGEEVRLEGQASDPDGDSMSFSWGVTSGAPSAVLNEASTLTPRFLARAAGVYDVELEVSTGAAVVRDAVRIRVGVENHAPVADAGADQEVSVGARVMLDGTGSRDPDGDPLGFSWSVREAPPDSEAELARARAPTSQLVPDRVGTYVLELVVSDGLLESAPDVVFIRVIEAGPGGGRDLFDPNEVYAVGELRFGSCETSMVAHWSSEQGAVGFVCWLRRTEMLVAPRRRRLLYWNTDEYLLREFHCDGECLLPADAERDRYPIDPMANDPVLPTPRCLPARHSLIGVHVWPEGGFIYRCRPPVDSWFDDQSVEVPGLGNRRIVAMGLHGMVLVGTAGDYAVVHTRTSSVAPVTGLPAEAVLGAGRARSPDGFWVVTGHGRRFQLWAIEVSGAARYVVTYAEMPEDYPAPRSAKLDSEQNLFLAGSGPVSRIFRLGRDGSITSHPDPTGTWTFITGP